MAARPSNNYARYVTQGWWHNFKQGWRGGDHCAARLVHVQLDCAAGCVVALCEKMVGKESGGSCGMVTEQHDTERLCIGGGLVLLGSQGGRTHFH
eukprot:453844-Amphidinium_carterae.1